MNNPSALSLADLPEDLLREILRHTDNSGAQWIRLSGVNRRLYRLFRQEALLKALLQAVARADQNTVLQMLRAHPALLLQKGALRDYSGRHFSSISPLQYAAWALDTHLLQAMLAAAITPETVQLAWQQLDELRSLQGAQLPIFRLFPLIKALQELSLRYASLSDSEKQRLWIEEIGGLQRELPVHFAQEYCRLDRAFFPLPTFSLGSFPRTVYCFRRTEGNYLTWFNAAGPHPELGRTFAIARGSWIAPARLQGIAAGEYGATAHAAVPGKFTVQADASALARLWSNRLQQLQDIKRCLVLHRGVQVVSNLCLTPT